MNVRHFSVNMKTETNMKPLVSALLIINQFTHPHAKTVRTHAVLDFFKVSFCVLLNNLLKGSNKIKSSLLHSCMFCKRNVSEHLFMNYVVEIFEMGYYRKTFTDDLFK